MSGAFLLAKKSTTANAVVLSEVPENSTCVGVPARIARINNKKVTPCDLDQIHIPDPVSQELCKMHIIIEDLKGKIEKLEEGKNETIQQSDK